MARPSETEKLERRTLALGNPLYFGERYMRPFDDGWKSDLPPFAGEMLAFALRSRRGAVILPPEFLKTTMLSQLLPLWLTYRYTWEKKLLRAMLLSEEEGMAMANLSVLKWHIENNDLLAEDFSDAHGRPLVFPDVEEDVWRQDAIIVSRHGTSKDPTWQAKGLDSKGIHGRRLDWLIGDDVVTPRNAFSPAYRRSALNLWDVTITTRLVEDGKAVIAGNFNHQRDLISTLAERKAYTVFRRPALHSKTDPAKPDEHGVPLWPENWSKARLRREQDEKPTSFRRIYLLDPAAEEGGKLRDEWMAKIAPSETPMDQCWFGLAIDEAVGGETADLDYFNVTVVAVHGAHADVCASICVRRELPARVDLISVVHDRFQRVGGGVRFIAGAKVAMDKTIRSALVSDRPELAAKVVPLSTPLGKARIEALGPLARSGWLRCWEPIWDELTSDPEDRFQELTLGEEWRAYPWGKHDDRLDGLWLAARAIEEHGGQRSREVALTAV